MTNILAISPDGVFGIIAGCIVGLIGLVVLIKCIVIVPQASTVIIQRLGKYHKTLNAGFHIIAPVIDSKVNVVSLKELIGIECYWLAANKYPMLSKVNVFEVNISDNKLEAIEEDSIIELVNIEVAIDLLPLPYHKKAIECYINNRYKKV